MEISGNGIYDNRDCGIVCSGCVDITENDVVGNQAGGIIVDNGSVTKVCCMGLLWSLTVWEKLSALFKAMMS